MRPGFSNPRSLAACPWLSKDVPWPGVVFAPVPHPAFATAHLHARARTHFRVLLALLASPSAFCVGQLRQHGVFAAGAPEARFYG